MLNSLINTSQKVFFFFSFFLGVCVKGVRGKGCLAKSKKRNLFSRMTFSYCQHINKLFKPARSQVPNGVSSG